MQENKIEQQNWIVVGLGNPGEKYERTRHNIGAAIVEYLVEEKGDILFKNNIMAFIPDCYMNLSGGPVAKALGKDKQERRKKAHMLIVVHDDIDLPFGEIKISVGKGSGGQKGVEDIVKAIGTKDFVRVRIGIVPVFFGKVRKPKGSQAVSAFVLKKFGILERRELPEILNKASNAITEVIESGVQKAMNKFN